MKKIKYLWLFNLLIIIIWLLYIFVIPKVLNNKEIIVPDVKGYDLNEALNILEDNNLIVLINYIDGPDDKALYTFPLKDSVVKSGSNINLYISKKKIVYYDEFIGLVLDSNIDMIENYCANNKIDYEVEYKLDNNSIPGVIINQNKNSKNIINEGDLLIFTVARSELYFSMPNLVGMNIYDGIKILNDFNIKTNVIYYYAPVESDTIIFQSVEKGNTIKKGNNSIIDLYVSKGFNDNTVLDYQNFIKVLSILNVKYDIIYIESNEESNVCLGYKTTTINNELCYCVYISK